MSSTSVVVVGFTGTRAGMSAAQRGRLQQLILSYRKQSPMRVMLLHGGAKGADAEADAVARDAGCRIVVYRPQPSSPAGRSRALLARNREIVDACDVLIAAPRDADREELRSGTWATVRYAREVGIDVVLLAR